MGNTLDEQMEYLTDWFFNKLHHDGSIESPYYHNKEYSENMAKIFLDENPDFEVPKMDSHGIYDILDEDVEYEMNQFYDLYCDTNYFREKDELESDYEYDED